MSGNLNSKSNRFKHWEQPKFDKDGWTKYGWRCQNYETLLIGNNVDIGCFTYMNAKYDIIIGDNVQIGSHCSLYSINTENNTKGRIIIGDNCLIGSFTLILPNNNIPPNTKIKAFSILK